MDKQNSLISNISYALLAQTVSLLSSFAVSFFAPKVLNVTSFGYWQLFLFYVSYVSMSRIGIIDGIYLKLGGKTRNEIDKDLLFSEWCYFVFFQIIVALVFFLIGRSVVSDADRIIVLLACSICMVVINSNNYFGLLFQSINETETYSIAEIIYNLLWFVAVGILLITKKGGYQIIIIWYVIGQVISSFYLLYKGSFLLKGKFLPFGKVWPKMKDNIIVGLPLLVSLYAGMLITGSVRFVVDVRWGLEKFAYFSFSMSLITLILKFISQVSMPLFPAFKKLSIDLLKKVYIKINIAIGIIFPVCLIGFLPIKLLITWWLPQYQESLRYFGVLLPICVFDGKTNLLYSTYLKVLRKEKLLLFINVMTTVISLTLAIVSAYVFNRFEMIAWTLTIAVACRSFYSEYKISKLLNVKYTALRPLTETIVVVLFTAMCSLMGDIIGSIVYAIVYAMYVYINWNRLCDSCGYIIDGIIKK